MMTMLLSYCHAAVRLSGPVDRFHNYHMEPQQDRGEAINNAVIILSRRGPVDRSHNYHMEPQQDHGGAINNAVIILSRRGPVDRIHNYHMKPQPEPRRGHKQCRYYIVTPRFRLINSIITIWNRNRTTAGPFIMLLSYCHAAVRLRDSIITIWNRNRTAARPFIMLLSYCHAAVPVDRFHYYHMEPQQEPRRGHL